MRAERQELCGEVRAGVEQGEPGLREVVTFLLGPNSVDHVVVADVIGVPMAVQQREAPHRSDVVEHAQDARAKGRTRAAVQQVEAPTPVVYECFRDVGGHVPEHQPQIVRQLHDVAEHVRTSAWAGGGGRARRSNTKNPRWSDRRARPNALPAWLLAACGDDRSPASGTIAPSGCTRARRTVAAQERRCPWVRRWGTAPCARGCDQ